MALITTPFFENPQFTLWIRHDDQTGAIQRFSWENRGGGTATCTLRADVLAQPVVQVVGPGESGQRNVPGNLRTYLTKGAVEQGDSVSVDVAWEPIR